MKAKSLYYLLLGLAIAISLSSCRPTPELKEKQIWIGQFADLNYRIPFLSCMQLLNNDSLEIVNYKKDSIFNFAYTYNDSLVTIDTNVYKYHFPYYNQLHLELQDTAKDYKTRDFRYHLLESKTAHFSPTKTQQKLKARCWVNTRQVIKTDSICAQETYRFDDEFVYTKRAYYCNGAFSFYEWEKNCYRLEEYAEQLFLVRTGGDTYNFTPFHFWRILEAENEELVFQDFSTESLMRNTYVPVKDPWTLDELDHQYFYDNCFNSFVYQGYQLSIDYKDGVKVLRKYILDRFSPEKKVDSINGYVNIRYKLNCNAQIGLFEAETFDYDYQSYRIPEKWIMELIQLLKKSHGWVAGKSKDKNRDAQTFMLFKFKNGELVDVFY